MRDNLNRDLPLSAIAQSVNLSVWRLCHIFKSETGLSPINYLRTLRMERARVLLETSFLSIKEIAHEVGINDGSHFVRDFKLIYGVTPTRYRMLCKGRDLKESTLPLAPEAENKIRQRIAKAATGSILPSLNIFIYILTSFVKGIEVILDIR